MKIPCGFVIMRVLGIMLWDDIDALWFTASGTARMYVDWATKHYKPELEQVRGYNPLPSIQKARFDITGLCQDIEAVLYNGFLNKHNGNYLFFHFGVGCPNNLVKPVSTMSSQFQACIFVRQINLRMFFGVPSGISIPLFCLTSQRKFSPE